MGWLRLSALLLACASCPAAAQADPALIPMPQTMAPRPGVFHLTDRTQIIADDAATPTATYLSRAMGLKAGRGGSSRIRLALVPDKVVPGNEAYHLRVMPHEIRIEASDPRGLFYGVQTLRQLIEKDKNGAVIHAVDIRDAPRFRWRGLLIDVSRHFFGKATLFKMMDEMAAYKLNTLHLHLTDDPGWRIEIPGYPKLTPPPEAGKPREYFTAGDMREIVAYAAERHIMVVPEIEMPSHAGSEAAAYPEISDGAGHFDPASPAAYDFIRAVLSEVSRIFPGPYVHFGGDEVGEGAWKDRADVNRLMAEQGFKTQKEVEAYFGRRVASIIAGIGKRPMAWDEQAEAGAPKDVVIQFWRKGRPDVLSAAAAAGHQLVMSPVDKTYFDYHQGPGEPGAPWEGNDSGPISIAKILAWEPVPANFTPGEAANVLGIEASVWTEFIESERYLEFMTFPRLLAFSEVAWGPRGPRDEQAFNVRLEPHVEALRARGINARRGEWDAYEFITN